MKIFFNFHKQVEKIKIKRFKRKIKKNWKKMFKLVTLLVLTTMLSSAYGLYQFNLYVASPTSSPALLVNYIKIISNYLINY